MLEGIFCSVSSKFFNLARSLSIQNLNYNWLILLMIFNVEEMMLYIVGKTTASITLSTAIAKLIESKKIYPKTKFRIVILTDGRDPLQKIEPYKILEL
jgi:hypothetical protein